MDRRNVPLVGQGDDLCGDLRGIEQLPAHLHYTFPTMGTNHETEFARMITTRHQRPIGIGQKQKKSHL
ncbi:MAG: hypothetical protein CL858_32015 [Cupriavidus sp.]|nr:hypothetical protein [Cupriavidus sp.]